MLISGNLYIPDTSALIAAGVGGVGRFSLTQPSPAGRGPGRLYWRWRPDSVGAHGRAPLPGITKPGQLPRNPPPPGITKPGQLPRNPPQAIATKPGHTLRNLPQASATKPD